jgi:uncharacterized protein (TIGR02271 family)
MTTAQSARLTGQAAYDSTGQKIGEIQRVFYDQTTNEPAWLTVRGGGPGSRESFVPVAGSQLTSSGLALAVRKDIIEGSPAIAAGEELGANDASALDRYYRAMLSGPAPAPAQPAEPMGAGRPERRPEGRTTAERAEPVELTSYEEQLRVGTEAVESGAVRLRKSVVTEQVETSVPLRHEEVTIERVPATEARPAPGHRFEEQAVEVTLHEERPTIVKETVPVETVRLAPKVQTDERRVADSVRRERIEVDDQRRATGTGSGEMRRPDMPGTTSGGMRRPDMR